MTRFLPFIFVLAVACGGANSNSNRPQSEEAESGEIGMTAADMVPRAVVSRADLTTAVDEKRYRATAPLKTEFKPTEKMIYLVGRLKNVPTDSTIEVRWFLDISPKPLLISHIQGSDRYQFVASFQPTERKFLRGSYAARIYVNSEEVGSVPFLIRDDESSLSGTRVSQVRISKKITRKMKARHPSTLFERGTQKLYVSFNASGVYPDTVAEVNWFRQGQVFHNEDVIMAGDHRYAAHIRSSEGLLSGEYKVEIVVDDLVKATQDFVVGENAMGPTIDMVELGVELNSNNMPKQVLSVFNHDISVIQCGLRFQDLLPNSMVEIQWIQIEEDGESVLFVTRTNVASGGSGNLGAAWEPSHELTPGTYKVAIMVGEEILAEAPFQIE